MLRCLEWEFCSKVQMFLFFEHFLTFLFGFLIQKMYFIVLRIFTGISKDQQCPVFTLILISGMSDSLWNPYPNPNPLHRTAPSWFITATDCIKLLPDIFPINPNPDKNAKNCSCFVLLKHFWSSVGKISTPQQPYKIPKPLVHTAAACNQVWNGCNENCHHVWGHCTQL